LVRKHLHPLEDNSRQPTLAPSPAHQTAEFLQSAFIRRSIENSVREAVAKVFEPVQQQFDQIREEINNVKANKQDVNEGFVCDIEVVSESVDKVYVKHTLKDITRDSVEYYAKSAVNNLLASKMDKIRNNFESMRKEIKELKKGKMEKKPSLTDSTETAGNEFEATVSTIKQEVADDDKWKPAIPAKDIQHLARKPSKAAVDTLTQKMGEIRVDTETTTTTAPDYSKIDDLTTLTDKLCITLDGMTAINELNLPDLIAQSDRIAWLARRDAKVRQLSQEAGTDNTKLIRLLLNSATREDAERQKLDNLQKHFNTKEYCALLNRHLLDGVAKHGHVEGECPCDHFGDYYYGATKCRNCDAEKKEQEERQEVELEKIEDEKEEGKEGGKNEGPESWKSLVGI
jgi:hypothetical protein